MDSFCGARDLKEDQSPASKIGCNAVVLRSIARASDFATLKSLRQVSSFWAQAVSRVFTQQASVNLEPGKRSLESLRSFAKDTKGIEGKLKILKINCVSEAKLELEESTAFNDILQHLSPFLESLKLQPQNIRAQIVFYPRIESKSHRQFPVLRTLHLANIHVDTFGILSKLLQASPALENLELARLWAPGHGQASFALSALQITAENGPIRRNWDLAPKLRSLKVILALSPAEAEALSTFPQAWEALELSWNSNHELYSPVVQALEQLLEKNKESLRCLTLIDVCKDDEPKAKVQLQFPSSFSKLRLFIFYSKGAEFEHITFAFGQSKNLIEYSKLCPSLQRVWIMVKLKPKTEIKSFWAKFSPQFGSREGGKRLKWIVENKERKKLVVAGRVVDPSKNIIWDKILGIGSVALPKRKLL